MGEGVVVLASGRGACVAGGFGEQRGVVCAAGGAGGDLVGEAGGGVEGGRRLACDDGGGMLSATVEMAQLFSPTRYSSVNDWMTNTTGALIGAVAGAAVGRRIWEGWGEAIRRRWLARPVQTAALVLMTFLLLDAAYPLLPTVDVSEVWGNLKRSQFSLHAALGAHPWHYWLVHRVGMYAVVSVLLANALGEKGRPRWLMGAVETVVFAAVIEGMKLFISGGFVSVGNVFMSGCGALLGAAVGGWLYGGISLQGALSWGWLLIGSYVVYMEWGFFEFSSQAEAAGEKMPHGAQWMPLYYYAMSGKLNDVRNFIHTISAMAAFALVGRIRDEQAGVAGKWAGPVRAFFWAGVMGLVLEVGQFWVPGRLPTTTDVFCFAVGGAVGAYLGGRDTRR